MVIVNRFYFLLILLLTPLILSGQQNLITSEIEKGDHIEYQPLKGLLTITHKKTDTVDLKSAKLEGKPLTIDLIKEVEVAPNSPLVVSFYRFTLPGQERGLHELPSISVKVGPNLMTSVASTYEVGVLSVGTATSKVKLDLENIVDGSLTLYPGEHLSLGYRYTYSGSIELTEEKIPLLDAPGLLKVGAKAIKDTTDKGLNIREVLQQYEATKPGDYTIGPSSILGYAYEMDSNGQRHYLKPQVQAGTEAIKISVKPFPEEGKPASFNGAIGPFDHFTVSLQSAPKVNVGDKIVLSIEIGGKGQLENVPLPELCCQPGFSGVFKPSDLPPTEQSKGPNTKQFTAELRLLSGTVKEIPPLEFAYFDPETKTYKTLKSSAIPISIAALPPPEIPASKAAKVDTTADHGDVAHKLTPIDIQGIKTLSSSDLYNRFLGTWNLFWIFPIALILILLQLNAYKVLQKERVSVKPIQADQLFAEALGATLGTPEFFRLLRESLILRLREKGHIPSLVDNPSHLPQDGISGKVREFLLSIDEKRFSGYEQGWDRTLLDQAVTLFKEI